MVDARGGETPKACSGLRTGLHPLLTANRLAAHLHLAEGYVSRAFCIKPHEVYTQTRGPKNVAEARQLMMYLAHVELGLTFSAVGKRYLRDRSTASYACRKVETWREDPDFDELVTEIEDLITLRRDPLFGAMPGVPA